MKNIRLYCYICGATIDTSQASQPFWLMTMRVETDRVFLCCDQQSCRDQPEDGTTLIQVKLL